MNATSLNQSFRRHRGRYIAEWSDLIRFPSVSADPARDGDCAACAAWLVSHLRGMGFRSRLLPIRGHPLVFAQRDGRADKPVVLFYGHYDVQPPDPLDAWQSPPFEPAVRGGRLYGRGAEDNKGQVMFVLKAIETLIASGEPLPTIKILLEGDEECGSADTDAALAAQRARLQADVLMVCDSNLASTGAPAVVAGLRGIVTMTVTLRGADRDLHSGSHGGLAPNSAAGMARLLASLHDPGGRVAVAGFYDSLRAPTREECRLAGAIRFRAAAYRARTGVVPVGGERGQPPAQRTGFRPTIEINGLHSGYAGPGIKTIIPASATALLSARLAAGQSPRAVLERIVRHLRRHTPPGLRLEVTERRIGGPALRVDLKAPAVRLARDVLEDLGGPKPVYLWEAGSIPVRTCASFGDALGYLRRERFSLAVIDLSLQGMANGFTNQESSNSDLEGYDLLTATKEISIPTIVVSGITETEEIQRVYTEFSVSAFIEKRTFDRAAFRRLIEETKKTHESLSELSALTDREREVLDLLAQGLTNKEIAEKLVITTNTVKRHLKAIFEKLNVHTRSAATAKVAGG